MPQRPRRPAYDRERGSSSARGYGSRWQKARAGFLRSHPLCALCAAVGRAELATVVDHITPHRGDQALFWDRANWQPLCAPCHNAVKQAEEKSGFLRGCDEDGNPIDPSHRWNRAARGDGGG